MKYLGYIHQHPDWPNFNWDIQLLTELLAKAHDSRGRLIGRMEALDFAVQQETLLTSLSVDAVKSSEIEGEHLDWTQVRSSIDCLLARSEKSSQRYYSMSAQICEEKTAYYNILESIQKGDMNITPWLIWFIECLIRALNKTHAITDRILWKTVFWEKHKKDAINFRQQVMLNKLFEGFQEKLTTPKWARSLNALMTLP